MTSDILRVFLGYDSKEPVTFAVAMHSLIRNASRPISVTPLVQPVLRTSGIYTRERQPNEATEFSLTRFLVPALCGYYGHALFMDSDVLVQGDVWELLAYPLAYPDASVFCAPHQYVPKTLVKFDGHEQTRYPRKNWSSVMLFNNARCGALTPEYVNKATGAALHRFAWTEDYMVRPLPLEWNWLVGEYAPNPGAKLLHYTNGAPCFTGYHDCDHADLWFEEQYRMASPLPSMALAR
jgi:hypothetical protein